MTSVPGDRQWRVWPEAVAAQMRVRYGGRPAQERPLSYDIAVYDEYAPWRVWIADQLDQLPESVAASIEGRLWLDEHFWPVLMELGAGAALRRRGLLPRYEVDHDGLTPDWTVYDSRGDLLGLVEVCTYTPKLETYGRIRAWHGLVARIRQIPVPVVLVLGPASSRVPPPDAGTAKRIARELKRELLRPRTRTSYTVGRYEFVRLPTQSPYGLRACFQPPSSIAGPIDARPLCRAIEAKAQRYKTVAQSLGVEFAVAAGAHRFTGLDESHMLSLLKGERTVTFQFNIGDVHIGEHHVDTSIDPHWSMPPALGGIVWLGNVFPFESKWIPNADHSESLGSLTRVFASWT